MTIRRHLIATSATATLLCACIQTPTPPAATNNSSADMSAADMSTAPDAAPDPLDMTADQAPDMRLEEMGAPDLPSLDMGDQGDMRDEEDLGEGGCKSGPINELNPKSGYRICRVGDFTQMEDSDEAFILGQDIELDSSFEPIRKFRGVFDGNGHTISGLSFDISRLDGACSETDGSTVYLGAFIDEVIREEGVDNVKIEDVIFEDVALGGNGNRLPRSSQDAKTCVHKFGGIFGRVAGAVSSQPVTLSQIEVLEMSAVVEGNFGGLAHTLENVDVSDAHLLQSDLTRATIDHTSGDVAGFAHSVITSKIERASFTGKLDSENTPNTGGRSIITSHFAHTLAGSQLNAVIARGEIVEAASAISAGLVGQVVDPPEGGTGSVIANCGIEVDISSQNELVGGLVGVYENASTSLVVDKCYVGELARTIVHTLSSTSDTATIGGLFGRVSNMPADLLEMSDLYAHITADALNVVTSDKGADCITLRRNRFPSMGYQPAASAAGPSIICDVYQSVEGSNLFEPENGVYRLDVIELFYGEKRD